MEKRLRKYIMKLDFVMYKQNGQGGQRIKRINLWQNRLFKFQLNKIAVPWPAKAVEQFLLKNG